MSLSRRTVFLLFVWSLVAGASSVLASQESGSEARQEIDLAVATLKERAGDDSASLEYIERALAAVSREDIEALRAELPAEWLEMPGQLPQAIGPGNASDRLASLTGRGLARFDARLRQVEARNIGEPSSLADLHALKSLFETLPVAENSAELSEKSDESPQFLEAFSCPTYSDCSVSVRTLVGNPCIGEGALRVCLSDIVNVNRSYNICGSINVDNVLNSLCSTVSGFVDDIVSETNSLSSAVSELPAKLDSELQTLIAAGPSFFEEAVDSIVLENVPTDVDDLVDLIAETGVDLSQPGWWDNLSIDEGQEGATAAIPCPSEGTTIPGIGDIGSAEAEYACTQVTRMAREFYIAVPQDTANLLKKVAFGVAYLPTSYLCTCAEAASKTAYGNETLVFHEFSEEVVDEKVSSLASQETLNRMAETVDDSRTSVLAANATLETVGEQTRGAARDLHDQQLLVEVLRVLLTRIDIEEKLGDTADEDERVDALPEALGGRIEAVRDTVRSAIDMTLAAGQSIGLAEPIFQQGLSALAGERYLAAYERFQAAYREAARP